MVDRHLLECAADLFNRKLYFECHEVLEDAWAEARGEEKQFLQGLIHLAVGLYHCAASNYKGAVNQLEKGIRRLEPFLPERSQLDLEGLVSVSTRALGAAKRGLAGERVHWTEEHRPRLKFRDG